MEQKLTITGKAVERAYEEYRANLYLINRRFQRKFAWELSTRQAFLDTIAKGFPIPLFLFAQNTFRGKDFYEIIDGMQRLNAVFSFIENEYPAYSGEYFDLSTTALTKHLMDSGVLCQKQPVLSRDICIRIATYELPYTICHEQDHQQIDAIFRRFNSNRHQFSKQDIRQSGVSSDFAQLVRSIACRIRGDVSHGEFILLSQLPSMTISKSRKGPGIDPRSIFWIREDILTQEDLRQSADEEQIADLLGAMLLEPAPPSHASVLDDFYGYGTEGPHPWYDRIREALAAVSPEKLSEQFFFVFDEINRLFDGRPRTIIKQMVSPRSYRGPRYFQVLFLALYDLLIRKEKKITSYDRLYDLLENISCRTMNISSGGGWWRQQEKNELITSTSAILSCCFTDRGEGDPMHYSYANELETILKQSYTENTQYDFKQGIHTLISGKRNEALLEKIFRTLSAMANTGKGATGYILIGVADKFWDAQNIRKTYGTQSIPVGSFYVTGVDGEVNRFYSSYDDYFLSIKNALQDMPMQEHYKRQIGSKMRLVNYHGKAVVILRITCDNGPVMFDNAYYTRGGPSNDPVPVSAREMPAFFKRFA